MSSGPQQVRLKRKRNEPAPDTLILESPAAKRPFTEDVSTQLRYTRVREAAEAAEEAFSAAKVQERQDGLSKQQPVVKDGSRPGSWGGKRTFHLTKARQDRVVKSAQKKKGKEGVVDERDIATFEEERGAGASNVSPGGQADDEGIAAVAPDAKPLKRPGRGSAINRNNVAQVQSTSDPEDRKRMESVADALHRFALDELTEVPKQKITSLPKHTTRRRDLAQTRAAHLEPRIRDEDMDVDFEGDYVYETYVLAAGGDNVLVESQAGGTLGNIGYLVITDEDQSIWETYLEDDPSDKDWDTDEEDENAEDYYGADYPEDELASDDEHDRDTHSYRVRGAADDEEWDEDTGAYSDDEYERTVNPWKARTPAQLAKTLAGEDESD